MINALRLVVAPYQLLTAKQSRALFQLGIQCIDANASLSRTARFSVGAGLWPRLARSLCANAQSFTAVRLGLERPLSGETRVSAANVIGAIEDLIFDGKAPVVFMRGAYKHYSVISGYTPRTLRLFDSFGYYRVAKASCGTATEPVSLHRFHIQSLIAVAARP